MARRLAAILAADVVGYSKLMAEDEAGTLAALKAHRADLFDPETAKRGGRIVKLMGDGVLVEFPSVVDAVECALAIQQALAGEGGKIRLRIGINLGDVIIDGEDIYGDGVNVAARLEALAEPGGVAISGMVHEGLGNRLEVDFSDTGEHQVKNIARPIRVFRWSPTAVTSSKLKARPLSEKPSIAVLPFNNMSGDPEQEYFSDGIAEDIITALSHYRELFVIARNTTFTYKGKALKVDQVCRELGARYLLEGSVRKAGNRVRVSAQFIDGETGAHLWAQRFDRDLDNIFAVQDEITQAIVAAVAPETLGAEFKRAQFNADAPAASRQSATAEPSEASSRQAEAEFIHQFAAGAGISETVLSGRRASELVYELGSLLRLISANLMHLLKVRAETKGVVRSHERTMIKARDNNALKFSPTPEAAMSTIFGSPTTGYLDVRKTFESGFSDILAHEEATFAAMQQALQDLLSDISPEAITGEDGSAKRSFLVGSKARHWETFVEHWTAKAAAGDNGMLDAYLELFAACYDEISSKH